MRNPIGYVLMVIGLFGIIYSISEFWQFIQDPMSFEMYVNLSSFTEEARTIKSHAGDFIIPVSVFQTFVYFMAFLILMVLLSLSKLFLKLGVQFLAPKIDDIVEKLGRNIRDRLPTIPPK
ncbi:MAG: hypothetical protein JW932_00630 [Deltaproteobacteria bacterium]|nr:hypothetical protein [Deltaproteobacteria bacterium]